MSDRSLPRRLPRAEQEQKQFSLVVLAGGVLTAVIIGALKA